MRLNLNASTSGPDEVEALALALESMASKMRAAGGDPAAHGGSIHVSVASGSQQVFLAFAAVP